MPRICPQCGNKMPSDAAFCDQCGASLVRQPAPVGRQAVSPRCPQCHAPGTAGQSYCEQCGHALAAHPSTPQQGARPADLRCPQCNWPLDPGDTFCTQCGYRRDMAPGHAQGTVNTKETVVVRSPGARLIMKSDGSAISFPDKPEVLIGREDPMSNQFPDIDLTPFGGSEQGVSRQHARILRREDGYFIEDLNSMNYTFVNQQRVPPGKQQPLSFGDKLRFGRVTATFQND